MAFFSTVEFYIILAVIAAAIVAFSARPAQKGPASEHLLAGDLAMSAEPAQPHISIVCHDDGKITLSRYGLPPICDDGAVSLAVKVIGTDVMIEERIVPGRYGDIANPQASFVLNFLRHGYYHVRYNSQPTGSFVAFSLHNRPGLRASHPLKA